MLIKLKTDLIWMDEDASLLQSLGVDPPEHSEVDKVDFIWVGLTPVIDVRYIIPNEDGSSRLVFRDGESISCYHEPDDLAHIIMKGFNKR